ncbi:MAG: hypothetical protein IMZ42_06880 [Candidatus Atribacteria bacterium]|nr:hypothetical protein [Candidatus Atribacteria bacterium]MBE3093021.1 hypothetical protein [Chloroflexota bacterium]MBE3127870.1 hypothetical protein [Candidatus Atribacteria bacterium]
MIKTYNPKETRKWLEYSSLLMGVILIIWGVISHQTILLVLGFFFILVVSNKTEIIINNKGIVITTTTLFLMKRKDRLNFKEMDSVEIRKGAEKSIVYFMRGWKGRKVLINTIDLTKLIKYIKNENPELIK